MSHHKVEETLSLITEVKVFLFAIYGSLLGMSVPKHEVLQLYKTLLRESSKFPSYNFRMYAVRRIKSRFRENKSLIEPLEIEFHYKDGLKNLNIIKRQVTINNLYKPEKLVIENMVRS